MAVIDVGTKDWAEAGSTVPNYTLLSYANPANDTGTLTSFKVFVTTSFGNATDSKIGTFYGSGTSWTRRDYEAVGTVTAGSEQTFTGLNCDVTADDILGWVCTSGRIVYRTGQVGSSIKFKAYDQFDAGTQTYASNEGWEYYLYGEGATGGGGNPNTPTTPFPVNAGTGDGEDQTLTCYVSDPTSLPMDVSFYDASDDSLIGTDTAVASGGTATILWEGLVPGATKTWYAIADNGSGTATSADWTFTVGTRSWKWYVSDDNTLREYVDGVKVSEISDSEATFPINTNFGGLPNIVCDDDSVIVNEGEIITN